MEKLVIHGPIHGQAPNNVLLSGCRGTVAEEVVIPGNRYGMEYIKHFPICRMYVESVIHPAIVFFQTCKFLFMTYQCVISCQQLVDIRYISAEVLGTECKVDMIT